MAVKEPLSVLWVHLILNGLHGPSFGGLLERKEAQASLDRLCDGDSSLFHRFHLLTQAQDIQATGISAVGYAFVTRGSLAPAKYVERVSLSVNCLSILSFLSGFMLLPAITGLDPRLGCIFQGLPVIYWSFRK